MSYNKLADEVLDMGHGEEIILGKQGGKIIVRRKRRRGPHTVACSRETTEHQVKVAKYDVLGYMASELGRESSLLADAVAGVSIGLSERIRGRLLRMNLQQMNRPCEILKWWSEQGQLVLDPPYQRGSVWGHQRRRNLIRSLLLGIPIPSIILNDRSQSEKFRDNSITVIDGKQRIETMLMFFSDELSIPGEWIGERGGDIKWSGLTVVQMRRFGNIPMAFTEGSLLTLQEEQEVFELVNFGGVAQGESDVE